MNDLSFSIDSGDLLTTAVRRFIAAQAEHLEAGSICAVAAAYAVPLVVSLSHVDDGFVVLPTRDAIESFFRHKLASLRRSGMPAPHPRISQVRVTAPGRITAAVEWTYVTRDGRPAGQARTRHFLECSDGRLAIQMVEFESVTYPQITDWFESELHCERRSRALLH